MKRIFLVFMMIFIFSGCATAPTRQEFEAADFGPYPEKYEEYVKAHYSAMLFDPYSAVFTFQMPVKAWNRAENKFGWVVCGTFNGKNRVGAYVGAKPFYTMIRNNQVVFSYESDPSFVNGVCRGSGAYGN